MEGLLVGLTWGVVYALIIASISSDIVRLASHFVPGFAPFAWIVWVIGALIVVIMAVRLLIPAEELTRDSGGTEP